jgi:hypothetical protein
MLSWLLRRRRIEPRPGQTIPVHLGFNCEAVVRRCEQEPAYIGYGPFPSYGYRYGPYPADGYRYGLYRGIPPWRRRYWW